jgi:integrase
MSVKIRIKNNRLYLDIYWKGSRRWETLNLTVSGNRNANTETMHLAETIRSMRERELVAGEYNLQDIDSGRMEFFAYAKKFADEQNKKNPLPKSLLYLKPFAGTISVGAITSQWLEDYRTYLLGQDKISKATAAKYLSAAKSVIHQAVRDRLLIRDPTLGVGGISVPEPETNHLTLSEVQNLADVSLGGILGAEVRIAFLFSCWTGLRISDLKSLRWGHISREPLSLRIRQTKTQTFVTVPLSNMAWDLINDNKPHHANEAVFPSLAAHTKTNTNVYLNKWAKQAGVEKQLGWHVARRTFGTLALQAGGDLKTVSTLLGHKKITHTAQYLKTDSEITKKVINALPSIDLHIEPKKVDNSHGSGIDE